MKRTIFILLLSMECIWLAAQEIPVSETIAALAEELADDEEDHSSTDIYAEMLEDLNEKPVSINSADESELSRLFFLSDLQIKSLSEHIRSTGSVYSVYEIAAIPGFDRESAGILLPFISLEVPVEKTQGKPIRNQLMFNYITKFPSAGGESEGPPWKSMIKYRISKGHISGGFTAEKDPGEKIFPGERKIPDFFSANLCWTGSGLVRKVIAGDFGLRFGMGTAINTGFRTGLSLTRPGRISGSDDLKPYTSTDENNYFRGVAVQLKKKGTGLTLFLSSNVIDATVDTAFDGSGRSISSFYKSGIHDTGSSLAKFNSVREISFGTHFSSVIRNLSVGVLFTSSNLSLPVKRQSDEVIDLYDFEGKENILLSAYYKAVSGRFLHFGEVSTEIKRRIAFIQGFSFRPSGRLSLNFVIRNYDPGFTSLHGRGLFSSSSGENIRGLYGNFEFEAARHLFVGGGCDLRYNPWIKYRCSAPSLTVARELRVRFLPGDNLTSEFLFTDRTSWLDVNTSQGVKKQVENRSRSAKVVMKYSLSGNMSMTTRVDLKIVDPGNSEGMMLLQDINYRFRSIPLTLWLGCRIHATGSWDSRIYAYENDLLHSISIPAFSGDGSRCYMMIRWSFRDILELRAKYGYSESADCQGLQRFSSDFSLQAKAFF